MPPLDVRRKIAAAQIAFYAPIAIFTLFLIHRYAFRRDAGWLFLCLFSLCEYHCAQISRLCSIRVTARIAGGAVLIAAELEPTKLELFITAYIMQPAGLALLMLSTIGFLGLA